MSQQNERSIIKTNPNTEVVPMAKRRRFTREYKERILSELDACTMPGEKGALLRREGLYSQLISKWRKQLKNTGEEGLRDRKRGPKANPQGKEIARLQSENERLRKRLEQAETIIDVQKKVSKLLDLDLEKQDDEQH